MLPQLKSKLSKAIAGPNYHLEIVAVFLLFIRLQSSCNQLFFDKIDKSCREEICSF